jgi:hypothetical protein
VLARARRGEPVAIGLRRAEPPAPEPQRDVDEADEHRDLDQRAHYTGQGLIGVGLALMVDGELLTVGALETPPGRAGSPVQVRASSG